LKDRYLLISKNIESELFYVGFKIILPSDFSIIDFYSITVTILGVIAVSLLVVFIILNNSLNKLIEKEENKEKEE
jgi:hypothetical protein